MQWKGISFFLGALTITLGIIVWFVLGTPREVRWLSPEEKKAAIARVITNQTGSDREKRSSFRWDQATTAFKGLSTPENNEMLKHQKQENRPET